MKKMVAFLLCIMALTGANAQGNSSKPDTTLKEYVGKYIFPDGSAVTSADIYLEGDVLTANSSAGASPMEKKAKDTFALVNFEGMAYFIRNTAGKVSGIKVEVSDTVLEGTKEGVTAFINRKQYFIANKKELVK